jgi:hypothetical protein
MLFRLSDTSLARLVPEQPDNTVARRLVDVESIIAGREDELAAQQHAYGTLKSATARTNALAEIDRLGGLLDQLKRDRDELREHVKAEQHAVSRAFIERWHEARGIINSEGEEIRLDARRMMSAEYRRIIDAVILYDGRPPDDREPGEVYPGDVCGRLIGKTSIVIRMKRQGHSYLEYDLVPDRVVGPRQIRDEPHGTTYCDRIGMGELIDKSGEAVLITQRLGELFCKAGDTSEAELVDADGYLQLRLAEPIQVGSPYEQRVNRSVEKIRQTIATLNEQGRKVTKLAVAQIGHMSHTTVHKHWSNATSTSTSVTGSPKALP